MNLKKSLITLLVLYLGYHAIIYQQPQSIFYSKDDTKTSILSSVPLAFENPTIQNAYEVCRRRFETDFKSKNKHLPRDIYKMLEKEMPDVCKAEISGSCKKGLNNYFCQSVLTRHK